MAAREEVVKFIYDVTGDKELAATAATMLKVAENSDTASAEVLQFSASLKAAATQAATIQKALSQKAGLADLTTQLAAAQAGLDKLRSEFDQTDTSSKKVTKAFADAEKAVAGLTSQQRAASVELAKTEGSLQKAGVDTTNLAGAFQKAQASGNAAATSLAQIGTQGAAAAKGTKDAADNTKRLGEESAKSANLLTLVADNLGKIVTVAAAAKIALKGIQFGEDAFKGAGEVEDQLARVQASAEGAQEAFTKFGPAIEAASQQVNVSTQQAAQALAALAQQGQSADEALQSLVPTLQLAKIGNIDVATSAAIVDDALDRFGLSAANAGDVVDILVASSKGAKDGLAGIANAMQAIAPLARDAGLSFKDTAAILGDLQQNGFDAGSAVRGLRTIFADLQEPTSKFRQELHNLGDDSGNFVTAINTIAKAGPRGQAALLALDGASRSLATALVQQGAGAIDAFSAKLDKLSGIAEKTVKAINDTAGGAFTQLTNALDRAAEKLAKPFLEPVRDELQKLANQIDEFASSKDFDAIREDLVGIAKDAVKAFDVLIQGVDWKSFASDAKTAISGIGSDLHSIADNAESVASAIGKIGDVLGALKNTGAAGVDAVKVILSETVSVSAKAAAALTEVTGAGQSGAQALADLGKTAQDTANRGLTDLADSAGKAAENVSDLAGQSDKVNFRDVEAGAESTARSIEKIGEKSQKAKLDVADLSVDLRNVGTRSVPAIEAVDSAVSRLGISLSEKLGKSAQSAADDLDTVFTAFEQGQKTADGTAIALDDVRAAFDKYAKTLRDSVANSDEWSKQSVEDILQVKSEALGIPDAFDKIGSKPIKAPDLSPVRQAFQEVEQAGGDAAASLEENQKNAEEAAKSITGALGNALSAQGAFLSEFAASSAEAVNRFTEATRAFFEGAGSFSFSALTDSTGIVRFGEAVAQAGALIEGQIAQQRQSVQEAAADWTNLSDASVAALARQKGGLDNLAGSLSQMAANARSGVSEFDLLGASDLSGLSSALDSAAAKVDALKQKAIDAKAQIDSIGASLQDQIDQINNNQAAIENRRFDQQLQQLHDLAEESDTLGTREYNEAVARAKTLHELKLKQIEDEKKASGGGTGTGGGGGGTPPGSPPHAPSPPPAPAPTPTPAPTAPLPPRAGTVVNLTVNSTIFDQKTLEDVARQLKKIIDDINGRS